MKVEGLTLTVSDIFKVKKIVNHELDKEVGPDTKRKIWEIVCIVHQKA